VYIKETVIKEEVKVKNLEELFCKYNPWWSERMVLPGIIPRQHIFSTLLEMYRLKDIIYMTGLRRVGKTTLMRQLIQYIIRQKRLNSNHIFYISLAHYRLADISLTNIVNRYRAMHRIASKEKVVLFLDDVETRSYYEDEIKEACKLGDIKIYAALANRNGLKRQNKNLGTRKQIVEISPLDFQEYLQFKKIKLTSEDAHLKRGYFEDYLKTGGIPLFVLNGDISYLHNLVDDIICKDIAAKNGIKQLSLLKQFFLALMENVGDGISVTRLAKKFNISPDTSRRYVQLFDDMFLINLVKRHGSTGEVLRTPRKIYAGDLGVIRVFVQNININNLVKNYVFQRIKSKEPTFIIENGLELDFFTRDKMVVDVQYKKDISEAQQGLFSRFVAKKKFIIDTIDALEFLEEDDRSLKNKRVPYYVNIENELYNEHDTTHNFDSGVFRDVVE
jgi:predicted AAA+ superfamily ATPase